MDIHSSAAVAVANSYLVTQCNNEKLSRDISSPIGIHLLCNPSKELSLDLIELVHQDPVHMSAQREEYLSVKLTRSLPINHSID